MKTRIAALSLVLMGCTAVQGSPTFEVHDVLFYGDSNDRVTWFYDTQENQKGKTLKINGLGYELGPQTAKDSFNLPGTLSVSGQSSLLTKTTGKVSGPVQLTFNTATERYEFRTSQSIQSLYLFQDGNWYQLSGERSGGFTGAFNRPTRTTSLQGAGELTEAEARAIQSVLSKNAPLVVAVLSEAPDAPLNIDPKPVRYRTTALYVQEGVAQVNRPTTNPGGPVSYNQVTAGSNSGYGSNAFGASLIQDRTLFESVWRLTNSRILPTPAAPSMNFNTSSALFLFLGQRPTGGYGFRVDRLESAGTTLRVHVTVSSPKPGSILTQAFTSPWALLSVTGKYQNLEVLDQDGKVLVRQGVNDSPFGS